MNQTNQIALDKIQGQLERKYSITDETEKLVLKDDLEHALLEVLDYCNRDTLTGNMAISVKELYIFNLNMEGNEGETARSEGGVSQSFEVGLPSKIRVKLNKYRLATVRTL
ncbi:phage head-tail connector protein [Enterococcus sp. BWB1-3]|uniref:phage head-tail connector protein n=1 Tax=Enterococcus sp. BWB1-3 TaxID=2787713 RepID=UPI001922DF4C|nr:phage head-tail connector protein [Enterococcus sp. BWB1-3]MBL1228137.1 phage head-tail connector protein [Enterococcus sp. BWB1-3]